MNLLDYRGQSYDNGANMTGIYKDVQSKCLEMNEKALLVSCNAHTLNFVLSGASANRLKQIKNYQWSTMKRDGLSGLAMFLIEN